MSFVTLRTRTSRIITPSKDHADEKSIVGLFNLHSRIIINRIIYIKG